MFDHAKLLTHLHSDPHHNMMMLHHVSDSNININYSQNHKDSTWGTSNSYSVHPAPSNPDTAMDMDTSHPPPPPKTRPTLTTNPSRKRSRDQLDRDDSLPSSSQLDGASGYFDMTSIDSPFQSTLPSHTNSYTSLSLASDRPAKAARSDSHPLPSPFTFTSSTSIPAPPPSTNEVDAISLRLGISWSSPSPDPDIQSALRGWEKFILNHFPLQSARIVAKSESRSAMLVEGVLLSHFQSSSSTTPFSSSSGASQLQSEGETAVFLFKDDLSRMRFLGRTMDDVIASLSRPDPNDEDVDASWNHSGPWGKWVLKRERTPLSTPTLSSMVVEGGGDVAMAVD